MNVFWDIRLNEILVPLIFSAFGFVLAYFLRRGVNILLFGIFVYAVFKGLESLKYIPDWKSFDNFISTLQQLGKSVLTLISSMLGSAGTVSILLFLAGSVAGLVFSRRRA